MKHRKKLEESLAVVIDMWTDGVSESGGQAALGLASSRLYRLSARAAVAVLLAGAEGEGLAKDFN